MEFPACATLWQGNCIRWQHLIFLFMYIVQLHKEDWGILHMLGCVCSAVGPDLHSNNSNCLVLTPHRQLGNLYLTYTHICLCMVIYLSLYLYIYLSIYLSIHIIILYSLSRRPTGFLVVTCVTKNTIGLHCSSCIFNPFALNSCQADYKHSVSGTFEYKGQLSSTSKFCGTYVRGRT